MARGTSRGWAAGIALFASVACGQHVERLGPGPRLPEEKARVRKTTPPPEWYWEPIEAAVPAPELHRHELPVAENAVRRIEGAGRLWDELPAEARERVRRDGVLVLGSEVGTVMNAPATRKRSASFGALYTYLREQRVPHVVTLDALFALVHLGLVQALAHVEEVELTPALQVLLEQLETRLAAEQAGAPTELLDAYRIARGVVSVSRSLATSAGYVPARDLGATVTAERALVEAAAGRATSPLLGVPIDYAQLAAPAAAARPGIFRALAWLGTAPLTLVARGETTQVGAPVGTAQARTNARAAMLLARICDHDVDATIHGAYTKVRRLLSFVWGSPDDLSLTELDDIAEGASVDLTKPQNIADVVRVDKVRRRAIAGRPPEVYDGAGGAFRGGVGVRVFGGHAAADSLVLQSLVGTGVGLATATGGSTDRLRNGRRVLPSPLDVTAWLGAPEARAILHESNDDAFDRYDAVIGRLQETRKVLQEGGLHASVHGSLVDALTAWANATPESGIARTSAAERMRVESLLAAWTLARHAGQPMTRARPSAAVPTTELRVSGQPLPVLVEPMPEVIGRLVGVTRQIRRGLGVVGSMAASAPAAAELVEIEDILRTALMAAQRQVSDEAPTAEEATALASLPARIARLEDDASEEVGPVVAVVYADPPNHRVLASATGKIEPVLMLAHDASSDDPILAVGAHLAHHEIIDSSERVASLTGAAASSRARAPWVASFRWTR